jgi:hypothetical protein
VPAGLGECSGLAGSVKKGFKRSPEEPDACHYISWIILESLSIARFLENQVRIADIHSFITMPTRKAVMVIISTASPPIKTTCGVMLK